MGTSTQFELHVFPSLFPRGLTSPLQIKPREAVYASQQLDFQDWMIASA